MNKPIIGFAGLTHLGINSAVASSYRGFQVVGFHNDKELVSKLNQGVPNVLEPQLPELMVQYSRQLTFSADINSLESCDIVYIAVDVPTNNFGASDLSPVEEIIAAATRAMKKDSILVVLCQVPPGFTRKLNWPEEQLFYQVETLIFGRAMDRAMNPERFMIGCTNPKDPLPPKLTQYLKSFHCPILPMRYESAELAKISINMFLVASVSTTNTLAEICEQIGASWSEISPALHLDKRIGQYAYLNPGLGIAGGNLERDLTTVINFSKQYHTDGGVVASWISNSGYRKDWAWRTLNELVLIQNPKARIALLGLTYKENTHSLKNSPSIALIEKLSNNTITAFDPAASSDISFPGFHRVDNAVQTLDGADVLVIMTPWEEFRSLSVDEITIRMVGKIVIDPYQILRGEQLKEKGFMYATLGESIQSMIDQ